MHQDIIQELYSEYEVYGYISENRIFDVVVRLDIPLDEVDAICEALLSKGVIIKDGGDNADESEYDRSQVDYDVIFKEVLEIDDMLLMYIKQVKDIKPPQHREWMNLYKPAQAGNEYARERLITMNLRVVVRMGLWHHKKYGIPLSDAIQNGNIGLIIALDKFDIGKHNNFATYSSFWIRQIIMRHANPINPLIRYPVHVMDKLLVVYEQARSHKCHLCGTAAFCSKLVKLLTSRLDCKQSETVELLSYLIPMDSIERLHDEDENTFSDKSSFDGKMQEGYYATELRDCINDALCSLTEKEATVMVLRFGLDGTDGSTLEQVGEVFGVTRERIRQIEAKALRKLRKPLISKRLKIFW